MIGFVKQLMCYPVVASLLVGFACSSSIAQTEVKKNQIKSHTPSAVKISQTVKQIKSYDLSAVKISQAVKQIDQKTALRLVWKLPQVQRKAKEIQQLSKGKISVAAMVDSSPTPEKPYYTIHIYENHGQYTDTIYWFRVLNPSGEIRVLDVLQNQYISLKEWKPN